MEDNKKYSELCDLLATEKNDLDSAKVFLAKLSDITNNMIYKPDNLVSVFLKMNEEQKSNLADIIFSCVYALGNTEERLIDERNEYSYKVCNVLCDYAYNELTECNLGFVVSVGKEFLRIHRTLQQTIMSTFFLFIREEGKVNDISMGKTMKTMSTVAENIFSEYWCNTPFI